MKARTLVLMLCIGLMCFTGFGSTTADLTENSTAEIIRDDSGMVSVNVVAVELSQEAFADVTLDSSLSYFSSDLEMRQENILNPSDKLEITIDLPDEVGWQFKNEDSKIYNTPLSKFIYRNPRDGINYHKSFFFL